MELQNNDLQKECLQQIDNNLKASIVYDQQEKVQIAEAMIDVQNFSNFIIDNAGLELNIQKFIQQSELQVKEQEYFEKNFWDTIYRIDMEIEEFNNQHAQYVQECIQRGYVTIELNIEEQVTLIWKNNTENVNDDFINRHIYENRKEQIQRVLLPLTNDELFNKQRLTYLTKNKNLIDTLYQKYDIAKYELKNAKKLIQQIACQDEKDVKLIFEVNSIKYNILQSAQQEERNQKMLHSNHIDNLSDLLNEKFTKHYKQQGFPFEIKGNFGELVLENQYSFQIQDKFLYEIKRVKQQILDERFQYEIICGEIMKLVSFFQAIYDVVEQPIDDFKYQFPINEFKYFLLNEQDSYLLQIHTYGGETIIINKSNKVLPNVQASHILIPHPIIDYFLLQKSPLSLIVTSQAAVDIEVNIIDLNFLGQICHNISAERDKQISIICSKILQQNDPAAEQIQINDYLGLASFTQAQKQLQEQQQLSNYPYRQILGIHWISQNKFYIQKYMTLNERSGLQGIAVNCERPKWCLDEIYIEVPNIMFLVFEDNKTQLYQTIMDIVDADQNINYQSLTNALKKSTERSGKLRHDKMKFKEVMKTSYDVLNKLEKSVELMQYQDPSSQVKNSIQDLMLKVQIRQKVNKHVQVFGILYTSLTNDKQFVLVSSNYSMVFVNYDLPLSIFSNQKNFNVEPLIMDGLDFDRRVLAKLIFKGSQQQYVKLDIDSLMNTFQQMKESYFSDNQKNNTFQRIQEIIIVDEKSTRLNVLKLEYLNQTGNTHLVNMMILNRLRPEVAKLVQSKYVQNNNIIG